MYKRQPHLGASTEEAEDNCTVMAAQELTEFLETGNSKNSVNFPNASMPHTGDARICVMQDVYKRQLRFRFRFQNCNLPEKPAQNRNLHQKELLEKVKYEEKQLSEMEQKSVDMRLLLQGLREFTDVYKRQV